MTYRFQTAFVLLPLMTAFMVSPARAIDTAEDAQRIFARVSSSVVTIRTFDVKGNPEGQGSGVVIGPGLVASNCHVVEDAASIRVTAGQGEMRAEWTRRSPGIDLCLLKVEGLQAAPLPLRSSNSLKVGEPAYAVGNPLGFGLAASQGLITSIRQDKPFPLILATAAQSPGSSGGGLFDAEGRLIGITTAVMGSGQNLNLILAADALTALVEKGVPRPPVTPVPAPERRWSDELQVLARSRNWPALENLAFEWHRLQPFLKDPLMSMALAQYELKRFTEAETTSRKVIALDENNAPAWSNLAEVLEALGRSAEAERALQQAEGLRPILTAPNTLRAQWYKKRGKPEAALAQIKEAIRKEPGSSFPWSVLGEIEESLGHKAEARHAFSVSLRLQSSDAETRRQLAKTANTGNAANGAADPTVVTGALNESEGLAQLEIGLSDLKLGRLVQAEDAIRKAVLLAPNSSRAWNGLGTVFSKTRRYGEAEQAYTKAIALDTSSLEALTNRASLRSRSQTNLVLALEDSNKAVALFPESDIAWRGYALINLELRDYARANAGFAKLDGLTKLDVGDLASWGDSLIGAGQLDAAQKILEKAETIDPKLVRTLLAMGKLVGRKGDIESALKYENRVLELEPANALAWSGKGYALMKLNRLPEAVDALETAVRLDPESSNPWINLGEAQMRKNNFGRAIVALEKAVALSPGAMDARLYLAQSYLNARMPLKSREQAQKLLDQQPQSVPGLGLITAAYVLEGNETAAATAYMKLRAVAPAIARVLRERAIADGLPAARLFIE